MRGASAFNHDIKHLRLPCRPALKNILSSFLTPLPIRSSLPHKRASFPQTTIRSPLPLVYVYVPSDNLGRTSSSMADSSKELPRNDAQRRGHISDCMLREEGRGAHGRNGTERIRSKEFLDAGEKVNFSWQPPARERDYVPGPGYIDDNGKATESSVPAELNLVLSLFCFHAICHPLSDHARLVGRAWPAANRYLWFSLD